MKAGIYLIANIVNGKVYIGRSKHLRTRKNEHFRELRNGKHQNPRLQNAWNKHGAPAFRYDVLEYCDIEDLVERETWWVELLDSLNRDKGYNLRTPDTQTISEETKAKISAARKGMRPSPETLAKLSAMRKGTKRSEETRAKMSAAAKGKPKSEEHKANISLANKGRPGTWVGRRHSEEAKAKMSAVHKGKALSEEHKAQISERMKGKQHSLGVHPSVETRAKLSAAGLGRKHSEETKAKMAATRFAWHAARKQAMQGFVAAE